MSIALSIFKFLYKGKVKKAFENLKEDPEFKATSDALKYHEKQLKRQIKDYEKRYGKKPELW